MYCIYVSCTKFVQERHTALNRRSFCPFIAVFLHLVFYRILLPQFPLIMVSSLYTYLCSTLANDNKLACKTVLHSG